MKSSGIKLPEVHGVSRGLDPNIQSEKQVIKPTVVTKAKEVPQIKPRLGQGRACLRCKTKMPVPQLMSRPVVKEMEKTWEQPKVISKVPIPEISTICDKIIPDYAIPHLSSGDNSSSKMVKSKTIQDVSRKIPTYPDLVYRPLPKPVKLPISEVPRSISDFDPEINMDFKTIHHFKRV